MYRRVLMPACPDKRLGLPEVTLAAVSDVALAATVRALVRSCRQLDFGKVIMLSSRRPDAPSYFSWRRVEPIDSREAYSRFMLNELRLHIETSHVLCVQWDGYVINPEAWDPAFLEYDYIGAPWPHFRDGMNVGNGGFSLRSKRLLEACASLPGCREAEDIAICRMYRPLLECHFGLRFAPAEIARKFAFERAAPRGDEFGFHGAFNMIGHTAGTELAAILRELEPQLLNRREHREMLVLALRRGDSRLARVIWQRLHHPAARRR